MPFSTARSSCAISTNLASPLLSGSWAFAPGVLYSPRTHAPQVTANYSRGSLSVLLYRMSWEQTTFAFQCRYHSRSSRCESSERDHYRSTWQRPLGYCGIRTDGHGRSFHWDAHYGLDICTSARFWCMSLSFGREWRVNLQAEQVVYLRLDAPGASGSGIRWILLQITTRER
jgi:hypothetical protein